MSGTPIASGSTDRSSAREPKVYVILVNWNGTSDTLECLNSLCALRYENFRVVVCDNRSSDDALTRLTQWALDEQRARKADGATVASSQCERRISFASYSRAESAADISADDDVWLTLIDTGGNLGFAGGCNVGIQRALALGDAEYIWLLNNDAVVDPDALAALLQRIEEDSSIGVCGSTLLYFHDRARVQALGGASYQKWSARSHHLGIGTTYAQGGTVDRGLTEAQMAYVVGASMLVSLRFVTEVGLLCEDYFLYFEELDWFLRARGRFRLGYAPHSIVYHKVGASTRADAEVSRSSLRYLYRNRLKITQRFFPRYVALVWLILAWEGVKAFLKGERVRACVIFDVLMADRDLGRSKVVPQS